MSQPPGPGGSPYDPPTPGQPHQQPYQQPYAGQPYQQPYGQPWQPAPAQRPTFQHAEPTPYHLMLRTWTYSWWRPVVGLLLLVAGMLIVVPIALLPVLVVGIIVETQATGQGFGEAFSAALSLKEVTPSGLLWLNLVLGGMVLWSWFLVRVLHQLRPRWLASVRPRIRWRFFFVCMGISVVALVAQILLSLLLPSAGDPGLGNEPNPITGKTLALIVVVLLTTPLQAAGEEYAFRGYLLQAVGSLTKRAWAAILVSAVLFAMAHGLQNPPLFFDRFMFGLIAAWLVIRTGGLEAGIALHVLNNLLAFGGAILFGNVSDMLNVTEISWWNIPITITQSLVYVVLVLWAARRMGVEDRTTPPAATAEAAPVPV